MRRNHQPNGVVMTIVYDRRLTQPASVVIGGDTYHIERSRTTTTPQSRRVYSG